MFNRLLKMKKYFTLLIILLLTLGCSSEPQTFAEYKQEGKKEYARGNYKEARRLLNEAMKSNKSDRDVLFYLGLSYQKDYMLDSAIFYMKKADMLYPKDRDINLSIYKVALELQQAEYLVEAIDVLIKSGDPIEDYYELLITCNMQLERYFVAFLHSQALLQTDLENPSYYFTAANLAADVDSLDLALRTINQAIEKFGEKEEFVLNKGIFTARMGEHLKAEKIMRSLLDTSQNPSFVKLNLANVLTAQDNKDKKLEGYHLYKEIQSEFSQDYKIDSTINALKQELKITE